MHRSHKHQEELPHWQQVHTRVPVLPQNSSALILLGLVVSKPA